MNIYNKNGVQITNGVTADLPITPDSRLVQELMRGEYVEMSWEDTQRYPLPVGSYIIPFPSEMNPYIQNDSRYPVKYIIFEEYDPEGKSEAQFEFTPRFQHPIMWLSRVPFVLVTGDVSTWAKGLKKTTWGYTGNVVNVANYIVDCINWISSHNTKFGNAMGTGWTAIVDNDLTPSATVNFEAVDIWSAAGLIAQAFDCEFHFDYARKQFRLGAIRYGTTVTLKSGDNISVANVSRSKEGFANAFLVKGSTRNLSQPTDTGENAQVRERLTLNPQTYPDSMIYTNDDGTVITKLQFEQLNEPILIKELIFDGVYPKLELYLYDLRERECWLLNELGEKVPDATNPHGYKTYSKWYCRLAYPVYNSTGTITEWRDYLNPTIIDGQTLQMTFLPNHLGNAKTSLMIGQGDFDVVYFSEQTVEKEEDDINENGFTAYPGDYRIVFKDESGLIIPTTSRGGIYPQGYAQPDIRANIATLINIVVDNTYKAIAQQELEKVAIHKVQLDRANLNNYTFQSNPVAFEANNISLHIGQAVSYDDGQDLNGGVSTILATHIVKIISQLDHPFIKEITVGNEKVKTSINTLQEKVETIIANLGNGNYLSESQLDLMIKNYGSRYFLSKTNDDTARGFITFIKGLQVGQQFVPGLLGEGGVFRKDADGTTYLEADKLYIRMKAYFDTVEIREYIYSGGNRVASPADCRVIRVEWLNSNGNVLEQTDANLSNAVKFRCYFRGSDGEKTITNDFVVGDQAYCHITNIESNDSLYQHHYWRLIIGKDAEVNENGEHYIDLSNTNSNTISGVSYAGYQTGSDVPVPQDSIVQLGNVNDNTRRGAIVEFVSGADSPSYQIFQNIGTPVGSTIAQKRNSQYSFTNKNFIGIGYSTQTGRAYMNVFGDAFIGDPNRTTYIEYKEEGQSGLPELNIKANVTFTSPETHQDTTLEDFATAVVGDLDSLQQQIDGSIETWFYDYMPVEEDEGAPANTTPLVTRTVSGQKVPVYPYYDWFIADGGDPTTTPVTQPTSTTERLKHLGDTFYDNTSGYAFRFSNTGTAQSPTFAWVVIQDSAVIKALADAAKAQDTADHKRRAFVLPITIGSTTYNYPYPPYDVGDLWLNAKYPYNYDGATDVENDKYNNDVLRCITPQGENGSFSIDHWVLASKYTDDTEVKRIIDSYGGILGVTADSEDVGEALGFLREVLGGKTSVDGGLILSELIAVKNGNQVMSGINGKIKASTGLLTPAAWYGGEMVDYETLSDTQKADGWNAHHWARALFRFDGSGYVADGNLAWNGAGEITRLAGQSFEANSLTILGYPAATQNWVSQNFVTIEFFDRLFRAYFGNNTVSPNAPSSTQIDSIEARYSLWTEGDLSCLGHGRGGGSGSTTALSDLVDVLLTSPTSGQALVYNGTKWVNQTISGGGGVDMAAVWSALNAATNEQINASHLTNALSGYVTSQTLAGYLPLSGGTMTGDIRTNSNYIVSGSGNRTFSIKRNNSGTNVDVSWDWNNKDGAGCFFRSVDWTGTDTPAGSFGFFARNSQGTTKQLVGAVDGTLKWDGNAIYHEGNFSTVAGGLFTSLTSTNATNLTVTIGGTTKTLDNLYALRLKGVQVKEDSVSYGDLNSLNGTSYSIVTNYHLNSSWQHAPSFTGLSNYWGGAIVVKGQDSNLMMQLFWTAKHNESTTPTGKLWFRARTTGGWADDWKEIAFADGNIATATALATARTLWGQSFDGTANVSGNMTGVGTITGNGNITVTKTTTADTMVSVINSNGTVRLYTSSNRGLYDGTSGSTGWIIATNGTNTWMSRGNVGIGTTTPEYKLHVSGVAAAQSFRSTVETGTAPLVVASSTLVTNLNADRLDGKHASDFATASDVTTLQGYFDSSGNARNALRLTTVSKTAWGQTYWTANGVPTNISGDMSSVGNIALTNGARIHHPDVSGNTLYIGNASNKGWVKIADMCSQDGDSYWKIKSNGDATFSNVYSNGVLTCLTGSSTSDERKKTIVGKVDLSVESIAKMPTVKFLWKHIPDKTVQVGTLAQSWQNVLPEAVTENDGVLGFQYGVAALLSAIVTARKVVDHEKRIAQLEKENMELRNELNKIKAA